MSPKEYPKVTVYRLLILVSSVQSYSEVLRICFIFLRWFRLIFVNIILWSDDNRLKDEYVTIQGAVYPLIVYSSWTTEERPSYNVVYPFQHWHWWTLQGTILVQEFPLNGLYILFVCIFSLVFCNFNAQGYKKHPYTFNDDIDGVFPCKSTCKCPSITDMKIFVSSSKLY